MQYAAEKYGATEVVDPRPYLVGSLEATYRQYPHLGKLIPAMGYFPQQVGGGWWGGGGLLCTEVRGSGHSAACRQQVRAGWRRRRLLLHSC